MKEKLLSIREEALSCINSAKDLNEIEDIRVRYLGKKGKLTMLLREMGKLSKEERPIIGKLANEVREEIEKGLSDAKQQFKEKLKLEKIEKEKIDVTISKRTRKFGHRHPLLQTIEELENLFMNMGFSVIDGPEIETVENNFDALNSPENHPSRDLSDTFYITEDILVITHTSRVQIRDMKEMEPPLKILSEGRTFTFDDVDTPHSPMFYKLKVLVV